MTNLKNIDLIEMDKSHLFHPLTSIVDQQIKGSTIVARASGVEIETAQGASVIDGSAGLWCVNSGYGDEDIVEAGAKALKDLSYSTLFGATSNEPAIRLADRVIGLFKDHSGAGHLSKVFFGSSGSDANDTAFKMVRFYNNLRGKPKKKKFIARKGAYHGLTCTSTSLTGIPAYHNAFDTLDDQVIHVTCPHQYRFAHDGESEEEFCDRLIDEIRDVIAQNGADTIAAFIAEPIMGTGGVLIPPKGYFEKLQPLLKENDILFVADEVITGFGRLGSWFATGHMNLQPDIVTLAKGLTSAYFPMSATVFAEKIWTVFKENSEEYGPLMHGFTYSGHPVGAAIGVANIDVLEKRSLPENAADMGARLLNGLRTALHDHPYVGDVRGEGLMIGIELTADKKRKIPFPVGSAPHKKVAAAVGEVGLLVRALPFIDVTSLSPPLSINSAQVDEVIVRYMKGLQNVTADLKILT